MKFPIVFAVNFLTLVNFAIGFEIETNTKATVSSRNDITVVSYPYIGCFVYESIEDLQLIDENLSIEKCLQICSVNSNYFGLTNGTECICMGAYELEMKQSDISCNTSCSGDPNQICGSPNGISVHEIFYQYSDSYPEIEFSCPYVSFVNTLINCRIDLRTNMKNVSVVFQHSFQETRQLSTSIMPTSPLFTPREVIEYKAPMSFNLKSIRFKKNSILEAIEIYCIQSGLVELSIAEDDCVNCESNEMTYNGSIKSITDLGEISLVTGYNQIKINQTVNEHTVLILRYNGDGRIGVTDKNVFVSDYHSHYGENSTYSAQLLSIGKGSMWRLCIEPVVSTVYQNISFSAIYYEYPRWAWIQFELKNSQANRAQFVRIIGDDDIHWHCNIYRTVTIGANLRCTFYTYSLNERWLRLYSTTHGLVETLTPSTVGQSEYYIYNVTQGDTSINLLDTQAASESYYFLTKSEFLSPGYLKGFWYYATAPGNISITVASIQCLLTYSATQCPANVGDYVSFKTHKTFILTLSKIGHDFYELDEMFEIPSPDYGLLLHLESGSIGLTASNEEDTDYLMLGVKSEIGLMGGTFESGHISYINENPGISGKFLLRGMIEEMITTQVVLFNKDMNETDSYWFEYAGLEFSRSVVTINEIEVKEATTESIAADETNPASETTEDTLQVLDKIESESTGGPQTDLKEISTTISAEEIGPVETESIEEAPTTKPNILTQYSKALDQVEFVKSVFATNNLTGSLEISNLNPELVLSILLNYADDLTGCLTNCSNNGICELSADFKLVCRCKEHFMGDLCDTDSRPCSSSPCKNNGSCIDMRNNVANKELFRCACQPKYFGKHCEFKEDICAGRICSWAGRCFDNSSVPVCKCFKHYSGDDCETKSEELKRIKRTASNMTWVAIGIISLFYASALASDFGRLCKWLMKV